MLVSMKAVLDLADAKKIAVGAFNITSLEGIQAVLGAAEELGQPVILQFAPVHESIIPLKVIGPVMVMMAEKSSVPVCVHLDHGDKLEILREALEMRGSHRGALPSLLSAFAPAWTQAPREALPTGAAFRSSGSAPHS